MPHPIYIICSKAGSEDKVSGAMSHFDVIERVQIQKLPEMQHPKPIIIETFRMRIVASWARDDGDEGDEFEHEFRAMIPPSGRLHVLHARRFHFTKPFYRMTLNYAGTIPTDGPGTLIIEHRVRRVGAGEWMSQQYPIVLEEHTAEIPKLADLTANQS